MKTMESSLTKEEVKQVLSHSGQEPGEQKEPIYRLNTKESAKGFRYYEWTVRGDTLDEIIKRDAEMRGYINTKRSEDAKNNPGNIQD
jgi:hypothetical protein